MDYLPFITLFVVSYLLGSIPFGLLITRVVGLGDIRNVGSGNIGATNVLRTGRKGIALLTLLLDMGKGAAAVWLAHQMGMATLALLAGIFSVLGHMYPVWLKFKGGKGVATAIGAYAAAHFGLAVLIGIIWVFVFAWTRFSSLASLLSLSLTAPIYAWFSLPREDALIITLLGALVAVRHRDNIKRLFAGQEQAFRKTK